MPHGMIKICVEMPTGCFLYWVVAEPFTIEDVKLLIFRKEGIPVRFQRLVLELPNDRTISDQMIVPSRTLYPCDAMTFILMPVHCSRDYTNSTYCGLVMNEEEGDENDEMKEAKEQEDANDKEEAKGELSSQDLIGEKLFGHEPDP